ncbi:uncharacterized protein LOC116286902 [Actinia tenebrosa]|uniref:Uncharacterized protein LOC116286902 n=1 Tax=Actinia tenebrosa TaxID=6105 RepID=A0A6P8H1T5_ACTTE|nr:uncharacterized protein LOC116286902 [Actinia tenebrosa]
MPRKAGLIKTYGRHKFRTVRTAPWVSPEDVFRSPVLKKEKSFETPTTIRKTALTTFTNLPKSHWNIPKHKLPSNDDKENAPINEQNKEGKIISNISTKNNHSTPTILQQKHASAGFFSSLSTSSPEDLSVDEESYVILRKHSSNALESFIPETPELITVNQENGTNTPSEECSSYFYQNFNLSGKSLPNSSMKLSKSSILKNESSVSPLYSSFWSDTCLSSAKKPLQASQVTNNSFSSDPSCLTSTPIIRANSQNSQLVTLRGQNKQRYSSNPNRDFSLSDCQVFVQPMKITPDQYQAARLSLEHHDNTSTSSYFTVYSTKGSPESDLSKISDAPNFECEIQETKKNPRISSSSGRTDVMVRDCVVSLEKLKLSPLIGQEGRKQSSGTFSVNSCNSSYASASSDDLSIPSTPPRKQASHMSFVEALTPAKISPSARELSAYQKLLLECEQDAPMKFSEYLKPSLMKKCVKIGEGVYGEVFKTINKYKQTVALKYTKEKSYSKLQ